MRNEIEVYTRKIHTSLTFNPGLTLTAFRTTPPLGRGGVPPEKLVRGVRPASQNPYPIHDQNLRFSLPYLRPDQNFDTLFKT